MHKLIYCIAAALFLVSSLASFQQDSSPASATLQTIACQVLEAHTDDQLKVTAVIFHQRDDADRARLGAFLRQHSGEMLEIQTGDGSWRRAHVARLKSCFGRGLLFLTAPSTISARGEFLLRLEQNK